MERNRRFRRYSQIETATEKLKHLPTDCADLHRSTSTWDSKPSPRPSGGGGLLAGFVGGGLALDESRAKIFRGRGYSTLAETAEYSCSTFTTGYIALHEAPEDTLSPKPGGEGRGEGVEPLVDRNLCESVKSVGLKYLTFKFQSEQSAESADSTTTLPSLVETPDRGPGRPSAVCGSTRGCLSRSRTCATPAARSIPGAPRPGRRRCAACGPGCRAPPAGSRR